MSKEIQKLAADVRSEYSNSTFDVMLTIGRMLLPNVTRKSGKLNRKLIDKIAKAADLPKTKLTIAVYFAKSYLALEGCIDDRVDGEGLFEISTHLTPAHYWQVMHKDPSAQYDLLCTAVNEGFTVKQFTNYVSGKVKRKAGYNRSVKRLRSAVTAIGKVDPTEMSGESALGVLMALESAYVDLAERLGVDPFYRDEI